MWVHFLKSSGFSMLDENKNQNSSAQDLLNQIVVEHFKIYKEPILDGLEQPFQRLSRLHTLVPHCLQQSSQY